nr:MAG TPA_asm: hypothetical protein [Caudoviricetes sp.]
MATSVKYPYCFHPVNKKRARRCVYKARQIRRSLINQYVMSASCILMHPKTP